MNAPVAQCASYFLYNAYFTGLNEGSPIAKVTSGEFQREFGRYRTVAQREAVIITNHGRDDLVLLAADEYARLRRYAQKALHVSELSDDVVDELGTAAVAEEASKYDHEYET